MFDDYLYVSDTSVALHAYFETLIDRISSRNEINESTKVLEIACNSGLLLKTIKDKHHCFCLGVDPAKNLCLLSRGRGLNVIADYWNMELARKVKEDHAFDIVLTINVLPHVPDPKEFLLACKEVLNENGKIYVQTSQCDLFKNGEFDNCYHEHNSYFTAHSFKHLADSLGLKVTGAWKEPIHSMSFLFELSRTGEHCEDLLRMVVDENQSVEKYERFAERAEKTKHDLVDIINEFRKQGKKVVGYGAAAKGMTLLGFCGIKLDYIVDDNSMKHGYLTPIFDIPIVSPQQLYNEEEEVVIVMLCWNFYDEVYERVRQNTKVKHSFVRYFPDISVES